MEDTGYMIQDTGRRIERGLRGRMSSPYCVMLRIQVP